LSVKKIFEFSFLNV